MKQDLIYSLQKKIGYCFTEKHYLVRALTHKSYPTKENNQILEFLGDSVLNLVISQQLVEQFKTASEGELTRMRALLVRGRTLVKIALQLNLDKLLRLGLAQRKSECPPSAMEDALEALIGAIYLDGGFKATCKCIYYLWRDYFNELTLENLELDPKSQLQVYCQQEKISLPDYIIEKIQGRPPEETFFIKALIIGIKNFSVNAKGSSKKEAEQRAAFKLLNHLTKNSIYE